VSATFLRHVTQNVRLARGLFQITRAPSTSIPSAAPPISAAGTWMSGSVARGSRCPGPMWIGRADVSSRISTHSKGNFVGHALRGQLTENSTSSAPITAPTASPRRSAAGDVISPGTRQWRHCHTGNRGTANNGPYSTIVSDWVSEEHPYTDTPLRSRHLLLRRHRQVPQFDQRQFQTSQCDRRAPIGFPTAPTGLSASADTRRPGSLDSGHRQLPRHRLQRQAEHHQRRALPSVATGLSTPLFLNTGLTNATTYYYSSPAPTRSAKAANSAQIAVTPAAGCRAPPASWKIGSPMLTRRLVRDSGHGGFSPCPRRQDPSSHYRAAARWSASRRRSDRLKPETLRSGAGTFGSPLYCNHHHGTRITR